MNFLKRFFKKEKEKSKTISYHKEVAYRQIDIEVNRTFVIVCFDGGLTSTKIIERTPYQYVRDYIKQNSIEMGDGMRYKNWGEHACVSDVVVVDSRLLAKEYVDNIKNVSSFQSDGNKDLYYLNPISCCIRDTEKYIIKFNEAYLIEVKDE